MDIKMWFKEFFSLQGKMGRLGFFLTLVGALIMTEIFCMIAAQLWYLYDPYPCWQFNVNVNLSWTFGLLGMFSGLLPITLLILLSSNYTTLVWAGTVGYGFFIETLVIDVFFVFYILQCLKRCRDLDVSLWYTIVPIYNPIAFLFCSSDRTEEIKHEDENVELLGDIPAGYFDRHPLTDEEKQLESERLIREESEREAMEASSKKYRLLDRIKRKIRDLLAPHPKGIIDDENDVCGYIRGDKTYLMGNIAPERWIHIEPEPEPDIVWNLDGEGEQEPFISPSANLSNEKDSSKEKNDDDYVANLSFFVSHHKNKIIYVKTKNGNESTIIIVREIDGEQIVYDSRYSIEHITWPDYNNDAIEITEEEFKSIYDKQTDIEDYVSRKVARNDTFYISMTAEDGMEIIEFEGRKYKRSVGTVIDEGIVEGKFDDVDLDFVVTWAKHRGGACNILSKSDFEEWWKKIK